jgi:hypothetical protein
MISDYCYYYYFKNQGLTITWPTSYEALVGRADVKSGSSRSSQSLINIDLASLYFLQESGYLSPLQPAVSALPQCNLPKVRPRSPKSNSHTTTNLNASRVQALGAKVIAAAGSPEKMEVCLRYGGADFAVDYTKKDWQKDVLELTKGKGVDVVYDPVGRIRGKLPFSKRSQLSIRVLILSLIILHFRARL